MLFVLYSCQEQQNSEKNTVAIDRQGMLSYISTGRVTQSIRANDRPDTLVARYAKVQVAAIMAHDDLFTRKLDFLSVGLGSGALNHYLHLKLPQLKQTAVEIDRQMIHIARKEFFLPEQIHIIHQDGLEFAAHAEAKYDIIVQDAFNDEYIPQLMMTTEYIHNLKKMLLPGGLVIANLWHNSKTYEHELQTYKAVFAQVLVFNINGLQNRILIATDVHTSVNEIKHLIKKNFSRVKAPGFSVDNFVENITAVKKMNR